MPHEVLVIANQSSAGSLEVANAFMERRGIPAVIWFGWRSQNRYTEAGYLRFRYIRGIDLDPVQKAVVSRNLRIKF